MPATDAPHPGTPDNYHLINGLRISDVALAGSLNLNDPMAVLALRLVTDGRTEVKKIAGMRAELLRKKTSIEQKLAAIKGKTSAGRESGDSVSERRTQVVSERGSVRRSLLEAEHEIDQAAQKYNRAETHLRQLQASRTSYSSLLWWFGLGWLLWTMFGKERELTAAGQESRVTAAEVERCQRKRNEISAAGDVLEAELRTLDALLPLLEEKAELLDQVAALDRQPLELVCRFGTCHVPFRVEALDAEGREKVIFAPVGATSVEYQVPDIPDGRARHTKLHSAINISNATPVLLSPITTDDPSLRGLRGEELLLAQHIHQFACLVDSARDIRTAARLLPKLAASVNLLAAGCTGKLLPASQLSFLTALEIGEREEAFLEFFRRIDYERMHPHESMSKRLEGLAEMLNRRAGEYEQKRRKSIEDIHVKLLRQWTQWSMLPLVRRYCPSFHAVPEYRYRRLGFTPEQVFSNLDKLQWLPRPEDIKAKIKECSRSSPDGTTQPEPAEMQRQEVIKLVRQQVEGTEIIPLSRAARLQYSLKDQMWHCALCTHGYHFGGPDTPQRHFGCPEGGKFSDEDARLGEQYCQQEDLLVPMLTALWNEKTTYDEVNRILREKEKELRDNVLEEEEALRNETQFFKEAARARLVVVEEVHGKADEVLEKFSQELITADRLQSLEPARRRELYDELEGARHKVSQVAEIKMYATEKENYLGNEVRQVPLLRQYTMEETVRRSSDAPQFVPVAPKPVHVMIAPRRGTSAPRLVEGAPGGLIRVRRIAAAGEKTKRRTEELLVNTDRLRAWIRSDSKMTDAANYVAQDEATHKWVPLREHAGFAALVQSEKRALTEAPDEDQLTSSAGEYEPPPLR